MNLTDTITFMTSDNYKDRFYAEYWQTKIRYEKLQKMIDKYSTGKLDFTPSCSIALLEHQASIMKQYLYDLEVRAKKENIVLDALETIQS